MDHHPSSLMTTGISLGVLHVVAGPDHLSALAALSVGNSWRAFTLGIRWGVGHSTGLVVVAIIFIYLKGELDLELLGRYCNSLVGLFMILLGSYGVFSSLKLNKEKTNKRDSDLLVKKVASSSSSPSQSLSLTDMRAIELGAQSLSSELDSGPAASSLPEEDYLETDCKLLNSIDMREPSIQRLISFAIGLLHGVAGPGGVLGVLPAVELRSVRSSAIYLGTFVLASTLSMGLFAALYGEATKRLGATQQCVDLALRLFSAALSILVGSLWFTLAVLGNLDDFFH